MGKKTGKRRLTVRARLKVVRQVADQAGGVVCEVCRSVVPYERATFVMAGGASVAYCFA